MTRLSDTQRILLWSATQRDDGSLLPLAPTLKPGGGTAKAIAALVARGLAEERVTRVPASTRRSEGEIGYGVFVTATGVAAIGAEPSGTLVAVDDPASSALPASPRPASKTANVLALLARADGATLAELVAATGWLPHTTRAALTGLRKKGHAVVRGQRNGATCYRVEVAA